MTSEQTDAAPETALTATDHTQGGAHASLTLLEYGDYQSPACILAAPVTQHLVETFGERLRFVFRHFPLVEVYQHAELAAEAAEAAAAQGKFWEMHHALFSAPHHLKPAALVTHAQSIGLDMLRFNAEMADRIYTQRVKEHREAGHRSGVRSAPSFFLNGTPVDVSFGLDKLDEAIHAALGTTPHVATQGPSVAAAEARASATARVSAMEAVAHSRLMTVGMDALLVEVAALLSNAHIKVVVVCDAAGLPVGTITESVLVKHLGCGQADFFNTRAGDVATREINVCAPDDVLSEVLAMMHKRALRHVLIVDTTNKPLGVLNARDGLRTLLAAGNLKEELLRNYVMGIGYQ